ncbi:hypothetical protein ACQ4PT_044628 [Festuca glaucescens]
MHVVTGAMGALIPKLFELLKKEYNLQKGVQKDIEFLLRELLSMHVSLGKVGNVPQDQLDKQVKLWADEVRELSYVMEDVVDSFLVSDEGSEPAANSHKLKELLRKMGNLIPKGKARRKIANKLKGIKILVKEVTDKRDRYKVDDEVANIAATTTVDPRLLALFKDQKELVGVDVASEEITKKLTYRNGDVPNKKLKVISICGIGGLGKTTLAKVVHKGLQEKFMLKAFISVGQRPDVKKVLRDIFHQLDKEGYKISDAPTLDEKQLIEELQTLLENTRYFIVIDDIWDIDSWEIIRCALKDSNCGSRIITTTRSLDVAKKSGEVYQLKLLSRDHSENLFYTRLYGGKSKCPFDLPVEISEKILRKCGGVPLAIITIASLLDGKSREGWSKVYESIGFGHGENQDVDNTRNILLFSYYDLPYYLRPCLLYLSIYPEDYSIRKDTLIWKWIAEGFIKKEPKIGQYDLGERYFNELVNRSMIHPIEPKDLGPVTDCRVHDLVLDMICLLSKEDNFVTVLDTDDQNNFLKNNARRLAIQKGLLDKGDSVANMSMKQVRSFNTTACDIRMMPSLPSFRALRILAMEGCTFRRDGLHLNHLGSLVQLRYLGLRDMPIDKLPAEIGKLKFLQTLDLHGTMIEELPQSICLLSQLKCLYILSYFDQGLGGLHFLGNLVTLEAVSLDCNHGSHEFAVELGKLTELRRLSMSCIDTGLDDSMAKVLVKSLGKLKEIQYLDLLWHYEGHESEEWAGYVPPRNLRELKLTFSLGHMFPAWIVPSLLPNLTRLSLTLEIVEAQHLEILGCLPELVSLTLKAKQTFLGGGGLFPKLRYFETYAPMSFLQGTMPRLEFLLLSNLFSTQLKYYDGSFVFEFGSLRNLRSLHKVEASLNTIEVTQKHKDQAKDALELVTNAHPNRPSLYFDYGIDLMETY